MLPQKIIIDTDVGDDVDDILALAFALLRPELDVRAITTVSYDTARRVQIVQRLLEILGCTEVPVAAGMRRPLRVLSPEQAQIFDDDPKGYRFNHYPFANPDSAVPDEDAIALMKRTIEAHAGEIAICSIGPLTNVATLLCRHPALAPQIQHIALMGGELELNRREHNVSFDAVAADLVLSAGVPIFMGTWSVTRGFVLSPDDCAHIKGLNTPLGNALSRCIELWWPHKGWKPGPVMYDVAPLIWSFERRFYPTQTMPIRVETRGEHTTGMTVRAAGAPLVEVSVSMLEGEVREMYLATIGG